MSYTKVAICVPHAGFFHAEFGICLAQMCVYCASALFEEGQNRDMIFVERRTSNLPRSRQECLEDAILQDCTHALFLDTDQTFPMDTVHRLIRWKKPFVGCNIPLKTLPSFPTARARNASPFGSPVYSNRNDAMGLEKVWRVGAGIFLLELSVLSKIEKPWFEVRYSDKHATFVGEDWFFCKRLEDAGIDILIDHELSRQVGHIGLFHYTHAHIPQMVEEAAA
jgi:hypothetical protein